MNINSLLRNFVLATILVAMTSFASADDQITKVNPDEVGSPAAAASRTVTQPQGSDTTPVVTQSADYIGEILDLKSKLNTLESQRQSASLIENVTVRNRTVRVIQDVSARYKVQLDTLEDHVRRVLQPELARVRGYASEGVRLGRKHETSIADLQTRVASLEALVLASSSAPSTITPPTTPAPAASAPGAPNPGVSPVPGTTVKVMNQSIFEQALSAFAQNFTFLCILVVAVLGLVGLFNLLQHNNGLRAAGDAAGRRDTREDARIARSVTSADWATSFTEKPEWATQGKVGFNRSASADGTHRGSSSGSYSFGDTPTPPPAGT